MLNFYISNEAIQKRIKYWGAYTTLIKLPWVLMEATHFMKYPSESNIHHPTHDLTVFNPASVSGPWLCLCLNQECPKGLMHLQFIHFSGLNFKGLRIRKYKTRHLARYPKVIEKTMLCGTNDESVFYSFFLQGL